MSGALWTVWRVQGGKATIEESMRWHNRGAAALWRWFFAHGVDESGNATGAEYRLVVDPPFHMQIAVAPSWSKRAAVAKLRALVLGEKAEAIQSLLGDLLVRAADAGPGKPMRLGAVSLDDFADLDLDDVAAFLAKPPALKLSVRLLAIDVPPAFPPHPPGFSIDC
jgi:hypothetical protein